MRKYNTEKEKTLSLQELFQLQGLLSFFPSLFCVLLEIWGSGGFIALCTRGFVGMLLFINCDISFLIYVNSFLFSSFSIISDF